jgi:Tfp pilus assembly protein PilV
MRNSSGGFTLFEVLGAVAILAILYTTLSTVAIRGLRSEGESHRILKASLLADWEVSEFELELDTGAAPEIGITESEDEDGFKVTWEVTPLQTRIYQTALEKEQEGAQTAPAGPTRATDSAAPHFLRVKLRVSWFEAGNERSVTRTIFAVDEDAAAKLARASLQGDRGIKGEPL